jgi:hypothetical protein
MIENEYLKYLLIVMLVWFGLTIISLAYLWFAHSRSRYIPMFTNKAQFIWDNRDDIKFHYISGSTVSDVIEVWHNKNRLGRYYWITLHEAYEDSDLGLIYKTYKYKSDQDKPT